MAPSPQPPRQGSPHRPSLGPTSPGTLVVAGLAAAAVAWLVISTSYAEIPELPWLPAITVAALAVLEWYLAVNTRARVERRPGHEPVDPLAVARYVVLAKASSLAAALFAGFYSGLLVWLLVKRQLAAAASDTPAAGAGLVGSLALVAAALWLERACRVPPRPDDEDSEGRPPADPR